MANYGFQDLMRYRIMDVILVSTPYDKFVLEEAGELSERMLGEFRNLDLHYTPAMSGVTRGEQALELAAAGTGSKLIITTPRVRDMDAAELAAKVETRKLDVPVALLAYDARELADFTAQHPDSAIERAFLWQGDAQILLAIIKSVEDRRNVEHDTSAIGVQVILVIEDAVRHYSSFLPRIYEVLLRHSQRVITEGLNLSQKILRMRARPKILLCTTYEEAEQLYQAYHEHVMGIISDVEFPQGGISNPQAGALFARRVREQHSDVPVILHSTKSENEALAHSLGASFLLKGSGVMLEQLERVMLNDFGFGDFVFRLPDGTPVAQAHDLRTMREVLRTVPDESLLYHSRHNHFSRWLKARTEFALANRLRPIRVGDFPTVEALRDGLSYTIDTYRRDRGRRVVADFDRESFDFSTDFYRVGGGSLGGKARGVAFVRRLLGEQGIEERYPNIRIGVPPTVVLGTRVFDEFLDHNDLRQFAIECRDDDQIERRFLAAPLPDGVEQDLMAFLGRTSWPVAVRSSSLLEDSQYQPFTGVYDTLMLANSSPDSAERLRQLLAAIKRVYASTFRCSAKDYVKATPYRLEEERMAVMLQRVIGSSFGLRFYPDFSGVVRSHNFYPAPPMTATDGVAAVALGLGCAVMYEGSSLRFCPSYPEHLLELGTVEEMLRGTQRQFWALTLDGHDESMREQPFQLADAEADGTLAAVASTYSPENETIYDGVSRLGPRVVTFAPVLKHGVFPLAEILSTLMEAGTEGMGTPVEIEFAVALSRQADQPHRFGVLQMRPLALLSESEALEVDPVEVSEALVHSVKVLGNGRLDYIRDLVVVDFQRFERAQSRDAATEIGRLNAALSAAATPYVLIGVGRWGSRDPWLGIPVSWDQVSGASVIVEAGLRDVRVTPSQGSHFFQNLTSFHVGYFTVNPELGDGAIDWDWLDRQPAASANAHVRHIRLTSPIVVKMNGKQGEGVILKPSS